MENTGTTEQATSVVILLAKFILTITIIFFLYTSYKGVIHASNSTQVFTSVAVLVFGLVINYLLERIVKDNTLNT